MANVNPTTTTPIAPADLADQHEAQQIERLEWLLAQIHAGRNDSAALVDRLPDATLSYDIGVRLSAIRTELNAIDALLAEYAAKRAPLPAGIEEVGE